MNNNIPQPGQENQKQKSSGSGIWKIIGWVFLGIVIAAIAIGYLLYSGLNDARSGANDARRQTDLSQIRTALELYANENSRYPEDLSALEGTRFAPGGSIPEDPDMDEGKSYHYQSMKNGQAYCTSACFAGDRTPPNHDQQCAASFDFSCEGSVYAIGEELPQ